MSSLVFTSLHRKLNGKPIDLRGQLKPYHKYWKEVWECESRSLQRAIKYYEMYDLGDTIRVRMPIDGQTAVQYVCPDEENWIYDDYKDMLIQGIVNQKSDKDSLDMIFKIKILSMNHDSIQVLMEDVDIGYEIEVHLMHDILESN